MPEQQIAVTDGAADQAAQALRDGPSALHRAGTPRWSADGRRVYRPTGCRRWRRRRLGETSQGRRDVAGLGLRPSAPGAAARPADLAACQAHRPSVDEHAQAPILPGGGYPGIAGARACPGPGGQPGEYGKRAEGSPIQPTHVVWCARRSGENVLAEPDALTDFGQQRGAFRHGILHLDGGLEFVLFLLHHEKDFFDGLVALAKRHVGSVVDLAVLYVDVGDAVVVLLDPRRRRGSGSREKVADVDVGAVVLGIGEGLLPRPQTAEGFGVGQIAVAMIAHHHLMLGGKLTEALGLADGDFAGDGIGAQRLGHLETVFHHVVGESVDAIVFDDLDQHAGVFVLLAERLERVHRLGEPPFLDGLGDGGLFGLLFRRQRRTGGAAACPTGWRPGSRRLEVRLDGLQAQFCRAEIELDHRSEEVVSPSRDVVEAVRDVDADLYAAENRVGFGGPNAPRG